MRASASAGMPAAATRLILLAAGAGAASAAAVVAATASPSFNISNVFSSHGVLQRNRPVVLWGWVASAGTTLNATWLDGRTYSAQPDPAAALLWRLTFPAAPASFTPFALTVASSAGDAVTLTDLLVGDVFLCSGQVSCIRTLPYALRAAPNILTAT